MKRKFTTLLLSLFMASPAAFAQGDAGEFIQNNIIDGAKLVTAYFGPMAKAVGAGLNTGWYNTAKPHRSGRFDLSVNFHLTFVPKDGREFDIADLGLKSLSLAPGQGSIAPTLMGESSDGPDLEYNPSNYNAAYPDTVISSFPSPAGLGLSMMVLPTIKGAVGIYKQTEVMFRFLPTIKFAGGDGELKTWGLGLKHSISQWLPGFAEKAPFDLSLMGAYSQFTLDVPLSVEPPATGISTGASYDDQNLEVKTSAFTVNAIISKKLSVVTLYMGLGYESSKTTIDMLGTYPVGLTIQPTGPNAGKVFVADTKDPISEEINGDNNVRANLGMRLKLGVFTTTLDYTLAKYSTGLFGLGVAVDFGD